MISVKALLCLGGKGDINDSKVKMLTALCVLLAFTDLSYGSSYQFLLQATGEFCGFLAFPDYKWLAYMSDTMPS